MALFGIQKILMCVILMVSFSANSSHESIYDISMPDIFSDAEPTETETSACYNFSVVDPVKKEFFSPNYPNPYPHSITCILRLTAAPGQTITLDFRERFHLEGPTCEFDRLEVHDGAHAYSPLLGEFCGHQFPKKIVSTERYMWLRFTSDDSVAYSGFKAVYEFKDMENKDLEDIGNREPRSTETIIESRSYTKPTEIETSACYNFSVGDPVKKEFFSPYYPNFYPSSTTCILRLTAAPGQIIALEFRDRFRLEHSSDCVFDRLEVHDGENEYSPLLGVFCGNRFPPKIVSTGRYMLLKFKSDHSIETSGFKAVYEFKDMENQDKMTYSAPDTSHPYLQSQQQQQDVWDRLTYTTDP